VFCTRCAAFNPPSMTRCGNCGARLVQRPRSSSRRRQDSDRGSRLLLVPLALALAVMGVVGWRTWETRQTQSAAYDRAVAALSAGNLPEAIEQFGEAGGYRDAQEQRVTTQQLLAPYQAALLDAQSALDRGENKRAVKLLRSVVQAMPDNADAVALLDSASSGFRTDLAREITIATTNRDWLDAERATLNLASWDGQPPDPESLAALRLAHAPILFTRNGALFRIGPDLADEALLFDQVPVAAPLWSPDRSQIAFFSALPDAEHYAALFVIDANGENLRLIDETAIISLPAWSPDGRQLVYIAPTSTDPTQNGTTLRFFDLASSESQALALPDGMTRATSPSWSGDGTRLAAIAFGKQSSTSILIVDGLTLEARTLLDEPPAGARAVSWSPGSDDLLIWTTTGESDWYALRSSAIYLISIEKLTVSPVTMSTQAPSRPVWSPDGDHFAYLDRGATLHVRVRTGIGERTLALPNKGNGIISWGPGGVGILIPALDLADPSMLAPVSNRVGPAQPISIRFVDSFPATDLQWGPQTAPDPALYDPIGTPAP
jgi:hypothetical protein